MLKTNNILLDKKAKKEKQYYPMVLLDKAYILNGSFFNSLLHTALAELTEGGSANNRAIPSSFKSRVIFQGKSTIPYGRVHVS